jgi:uncharacterized protein YbjT (DUF2867 family)
MLLVCGATGQLGGCVARRLADHTPRLLLRRDAAALPAHEFGGEVMRGDLRDPATLERALRGVSTVVTTVTAMGRALGGERLDIRAVDGRGSLALVDAAERAGVQRFVYVSYAGASDAQARGFPLAAAKRAVERRLIASSMRHVIVRPDAFQEVWLSPLTGFDWSNGRMIVFGRGHAQARYVAVDDVAVAIAHWAFAEDAPAIVEFGGPDALTRTQVVAIFEDAAQRRLRTLHVPRAALRAGMRVLRRVRPELASVMGLALSADLDDARWTDAPLRALGIEPRGIREYVNETVAAGAHLAG